MAQEEFEKALKELEKTEAKAFSKGDFDALRELIDRRPLVASSFLMNQKDYEDLTCVPCERCGHLRHPEREHTQEDCNNCMVSEVMDE